MSVDMSKSDEVEPPEVDEKTLRRAVGASMIGNATEWYDYGVYAYLTAEITHNFFPNAGNAATLLVYAVSFILRPLGGIVWGPIGDRLGRNKVMAMTIILMSVGTALVGLIPNYQSIGIWAPIFLVLLRIVQGFSTGGEYGGAATFMAEYSPDKKRGFWGSFLECGTLLGFSGGLAVVLILRASLSDDAMMSWGWRIPFLIGLPLGLVGLYLRSRMEDTPVFRELQDNDEAEEAATGALKSLFRDYWQPILRLFLMVVALNIANYTLLTYMPTYMTSALGISATKSDIVLLIGQLIMVALIWIAGSTSDRVGRKPMWWFSLTAMFVLAVPCFWLMGQGLGWAIVGFTVLGLVYLPQLGTISATFPAMFPAHVRYAGMAISYNISTAAFGGTASLVNDWMVGWGGRYMPAYYMMLAMVIGMIGLVKVPETAGESIRGRGIPGTDDEEEQQPRDKSGIHNVSGIRDVSKEFGVRRRPRGQ
ncbi:general substrate transporter Major facilitator superfamily protein [Flexivirga endophytica]|uniref:Putative proline/betaine transporter n=1 Tax=Flexivirga endophytica TaxID=1849103 RepID=A0A916WVT9_9MICO|nr:MFS transporter [Flexivirga endophytica]GGB33904.1 general substrate transporter Major facilitator superfamily protein [Flexivirga endophytica]GHB41878.1 general substrate transporter Major facilitator superfamily protein [Flexivirga endophytica]